MNITKTNTGDRWAEKHYVKPQPVAFVSPMSVEVMSDNELLHLLQSRGVDCTRQTRVTKYGAVYYV